jgi:regulator of replication initiation timing
MNRSATEDHNSIVDHQQTDTSTGLQPDLKSIEGSLKALWERARRASEAIHSLREERKALSTKVDELTTENRRLQQELMKRDQLLKSVTASLEEAAAKKVTTFPDGERAALAARVKVLLAKLETYL